MAPVVHKLCTWRDLKDGTVTISELADFHEAMLEEAEYSRRMRAAAEEENPR